MTIFLRNLAYRLLDWTDEPVSIGTVCDRLGRLARSPMNFVFTRRVQWSYTGVRHNEVTVRGERGRHTPSGICIGFDTNEARYLPPWLAVRLAWYIVLTVAALMWQELKEKLRGSFPF